MDKIVNIQNLDPTTLELQTYSTDDQSLIYSLKTESNIKYSKMVYMRLLVFTIFTIFLTKQTRNEGRKKNKSQPLKTAPSKFLQ